MTTLTPAEVILHGLGITEPKEIDVEAIAWELGARIKYRPLDNCEARIIGNGGKAIITVNSRSNNPRRQRFSVAHELGHWKFHRNRLLMCQTADIGGSFDVLSPERVADMFASDLLMPDYLLNPIARTQSKTNFQIVRDVSDVFDTSMTATAIRLVEKKHFTAVLVCHGTQGIKWFTRSPDIPEHWFPSAELSSESFAFDILFGGKPDDKFPRKIGADAWFNRWDADRYEVQEQTIRTAETEILSLVIITDEKML